MTVKYLSINNLPNHPIGKEKKILLLADTDHNSQTVIDYINAFQDYSKNLITLINPIKSKVKNHKVNHSAIIIHYSISILTTRFINSEWLDLISKFNGIKLLIIQDEYRFINLAHYMINKLNINYVFSSLNVINLKKVYPKNKFSNIVFIHVLPGYISKTMLSIKKKIIRKNLDIVYRSYELDSFYGKYGIQKNSIPILLNDYLIKLGMNIDIKTDNNSRMFKEDWLNFICSSKSLLVIPGGSDFFDFTGEIYQKNQLFKNKFPNMNNSDIYKNYLKNLKQKSIVHKTITPKIFEAMCCETVLLVYTTIPMLIKDKHYISINKNLTNIDDVISKLNNKKFCENLVSNCKKDFVECDNFHYKYLINKVDCLLDYD